MENKAHAMAAGIFVVVMSAVLLALAAWLTRDTGQRHTYEISTRQSITGLQPQAAVRFRGVEVGKVSDIGFDPKQEGNVLVRIEVDKEVPVKQDTFATLSYQGVTGLAFIQLDDRGKKVARIEPNDDAPPRIPLEPGLLAKLEERGEVILTQVEQVTQRINNLLTDENQKRFSSAIANIDSAAGNIGQLTARLDKRIDPVLTDATTTMKSVQKSADEIGRTAADFGSTARRLNQRDGPIDRLAEGTQALSQAADSFNGATLPRINRVTEDASRAVRQLGRTARGVQENPQSLIFGNGELQPGPGEPGFTAPAGGRP
jgi:phospholipid/cholesterol/gamma-HCH transport system substrate-binding protein